MPSASAPIHVVSAILLTVSSACGRADADDAASTGSTGASAPTTSASSTGTVDTSNGVTTGSVATTDVVDTSGVADTSSSEGGSEGPPPPVDCADAELPVSPGSGVNNRFRYVSGLCGFVLLADAASQLQFLRTAG